MEQIIHFISNQSDLFLFTQTGFWLFFAFVLGVHSIIYKHRFSRSLFLFISSLFFYYKTGGYFFTLLVFSTIVDYSIGLALGATSTKWKRRSLLITSLVINLSILSYFKYTYFIAESISSLSGNEIEVMDYAAHFLNQLFGTSFNTAEIVLPVGISFFTFQTISYSIDVYRGQLKPVKSIIDFGFYVSFFPQLISGPIVRAKTFIPQIYQKVVTSEKWIWHSFFLILGGLFKKMVLSDYISVNLVDSTFEHPIAHSGIEILSAIYAYALQIYCDFSGYTDIALGVGVLLGFRLPINFNYPYKATSITDFWRRWHISLSTWLRDYLYIPLGGNRKGKLRTHINLLLTMLIGGLWHGAALKFVIWGGLHGFALIIDRLLKKLIKGSTNCIVKAAAWFMTFHFVVFAWIVFRVSSIENAKIMLYRLFNVFNVSQITLAVAKQPYLYMLLLVGFGLHFLPTKLHKKSKLLLIILPWWIKIIAAALFVLLIVTFHDVDSQPFIYFRF